MSKPIQIRGPSHRNQATTGFYLSGDQRVRDKDRWLPNSSIGRNKKPGGYNRLEPLFQPTCKRNLQGGALPCQGAEAHQEIPIRRYRKDDRMLRHQFTTWLLQQSAGRDKRQKHYETAERPE